MEKRYKIIISLAVAAAVILLAFLYFSRPRNAETFKIQGQELRLMVVDNPLSHAKGLSGYQLDEFTKKADGMLFVFKDAKQRTFWMKNMTFPIDVIWLNEGKIMKIDRNVQIFDESGNISVMTSNPFEVDMVLELPAGKASELGLISGLVQNSLRLYGNSIDK
jgi:uncharacterized membrane protein (UPF0127 family)